MSSQAYIQDSTGAIWALTVATNGSLGTFKTALRTMPLVPPGTPTAIYLQDANGITWAIDIAPNGSLIPTPTSGPPTPLYIQDSNRSVWALGIDTYGAPTTLKTTLTAIPSPPSSGNSTITLQNILDRVAAKGISTPLSKAAGYNVDLAIAMANDVMADIIAERFNWKFNRATAAPFLTNSWQQDYPQIGLTTVGWLEDCDRIDINNTSMPKPIRQLNVRRGLSRCSLSWAPVNEICWMYNKHLSWGAWPGANVIYKPQIAPVTYQNPVMNFIDANGNYLILTTVGTTGSAAPAALPLAAEGVAVNDGTCVWTVVNGNSQGFRLYPLPGAAGPVWQIIPYYQIKAPKLIDLQSLINPIPDDYSRFFQLGMEVYCGDASPDPNEVKKAAEKRPLWLKAMFDIKKQGDKEPDAYAMLPATSPVESIYAWKRNPQDPSQPY